MDYTTLFVKESSGSLTVTFNRLELPNKNSINAHFLEELNDVLDRAERDSACRLVILEGQRGVFCSGMDFMEMAKQPLEGAEKRFTPQLYMDTLKRFTLTPKVIIANVDGQVIAGGLGLVAASDLVFATPRSQFSLSEALWGLLPANVMPFLIRRVGFQPAYRMTLTTQPITAEEAKQIHLIDEVHEKPEALLRRLRPRLMRLEETTIRRMKQYFKKMWFMNERMEHEAIAELTDLLAQPNVQGNISNFVNYGRFPWEPRE